MTVNKCVFLKWCFIISLEDGLLLTVSVRCRPHLKDLNQAGLLSFQRRYPFAFFTYFLGEETILLFETICQVLGLRVVVNGQIHVKRKTSTFPAVGEGGQVTVDLEDASSLQLQPLLLGFGPRLL
jgi:hypothetical protein